MKARHPGGRTCLGALLLMPATLPLLAARAGLARLRHSIGGGQS